MPRHNYWHFNDIRDVDRQREYQKGNYIEWNDKEWYRYAVHNIIDESDPLYYDEWEARQWLYDHLLSIDAEIDYLPTYEELRWK